MRHGAAMPDLSSMPAVPELSKEAANGALQWATWALGLCSTALVGLGIKSHVSLKRKVSVLQRSSMSREDCNATTAQLLEEVKREAALDRDDRREFRAEFREKTSEICEDIRGLRGDFTTHLRDHAQGAGRG